VASCLHFFIGHEFSETRYPAMYVALNGSKRQVSGRNNFVQRKSFDKTKDQNLTHRTLKLADNSTAL